ncbi:unnamed protein product [Cylicocyclus nassatus]|uniref:Uncharacterized protein n=1 Tax=Cylicocyclus nassatus TaxID=53992 RepID=A0AA36GVH7_CYLNA|nr:unnamed protein product [Cylicocyclus nassatus]
MLWSTTTRAIVLVVTSLFTSLAQEICFPDTCADPATDSWFSYNACCDNACCYRLRFWVIPACIAGVGFVAGAFFALCFQCR